MKKNLLSFYHPVENMKWFCWNLFIMKRYTLLHIMRTPTFKIILKLWSFCYVLFNSFIYSFVLSRNFFTWPCCRTIWCKIQTNKTHKEGCVDENLQKNQQTNKYIELFWSNSNDGGKKQKKTKSTHTEIKYCAQFSSDLENVPRIHGSKHIFQSIVQQVQENNK